MHLETFGELKAYVAGGPDREGGGTGPLVVLLHGFGAPGDDLAQLWRVLDVPREVRFIFPVGPLELDFGLGESRAWWLIDVARLERELAAGRQRDLTREVPRGSPEARQQVMGLLDEVERRLSVAGKQLLFGGFSQGAMLALDVALRSQRPLAALALLSGTLLAAHQWVPLMSARRDLPVLQSHGRADPLLPFTIAEQLRDHLRAAGLALQWYPFNGGHEIPYGLVELLGRFIRETLTAGTD
jgi:phospholipase/carboxylesterase